VLPDLLVHRDQRARRVKSDRPGRKARLEQSAPPDLLARKDQRVRRAKSAPLDHKVPLARSVM
jgi:hypothetical protein